MPCFQDWLLSGNYFAPLPFFAIFQYSEGVSPIVFLNKVANDVRLLKPTLSAIYSTVRLSESI